MGDKHSLNYDVRELKLGASFTNNKASQYHTIKYDFKPASVDVNKMATVDVGTNNQVTVTVPHLDGAGVPQTVFKGSQRPYTKECVLIIDRVTGEITLEKLSSNIQVKKTRQETSQKPRPLTPVTADFMNTTQRSTSRTRVTTNKRANNQGGGSSAAQANSQARFSSGAQKPQNMMRSPPRVKTSPPQAPWSGGGNSTHASLPMIGLDDALAGASPPPAPAHNAHVPAHNAHLPAHGPSHNAPGHNSHGPSHNAHVPGHSAHPPAHNTHAPIHNAHAPAHNAHAPAHSAHNAHMPNHAPHAPASARHLPPPASIPPPAATTQPQAPRQEDSSSSSSSDSDSGSGSDSDSDDNDSSARQSLTNGTASNTALPTDVLNDDLCLSESGSDSD